MGCNRLLIRAPGLRQAVNRSQMLDLARFPPLIKEVVADRGGYLVAETVEWDAYWQPCLAGLDGAGQAQLAALRDVRASYIGPSFEAAESVAYCHRYFALLKRALAGDFGEASRAILARLATLETFAIRGYRDSVAQAAGVINVRHPVYLLSRIRWPRAISDPKFLPFVCVPGGGTPTAAGRLFYHYRQLALGGPAGEALLIYPAVAKPERTASFQRIEWLTAAFRSKPDPWSRRRGRAIADLAIAPFLATRNEAMAQPEAEIAFADIGGGTGVLVSRICSHLLRAHRTVVGDRAFAWSFIDLGVQDPARHTADRSLRRAMSVAEYLQADYRTWVLEEATRQRSGRWHVALLCRLLNNRSGFRIARSADPHITLQLGLKRNGGPGCPDAPWQPVECLRPDRPQPERLSISKRKVPIAGGSSLSQLSLSDYFRALHEVVSADQVAPDPPGTVYFPLRQFDPESLVLSDGSSLLERLCSLAELVVIEDTDLAPEQLVEHLAGC